jgi:hypothetical protein
MERVFDLLCLVNQQFEPAKVRFYFSEPANYIDNSSYFIHDFSDGYRMMVENNIMGVVNTYIVADPGGACGYAYFPYDGPPGGGIALKQSCSGPGNSTFAHELGHFFSLPHTFDGWQWNPEFVNGSNCTIAGDLFCDTRADFLDYRWNCPHNPFKQDPNGDLYNPDGSNFMSYSNEPCSNNFSLEQQSAMKYSMVNDYNGTLTKHPLPNQTQITVSPQLISPADSSLLTYKNQLFTWSKVPGAQYYHFVTHRFNIFNISRIETITTDTFFLATNLRAKTKYEWKVKAFHHNESCAPVARAFYETNESVGIVNEFEQKKEISMYPNPAKSGEIIYLKLPENIQSKEINLYNFQGQKLTFIEVQKEGNLNLIKIPELKPGMYYIGLQDNHMNEFLKLMIYN